MIPAASDQMTASGNFSYLILRYFTFKESRIHYRMPWKPLSTQCFSSWVQQDDGETMNLGGRSSHQPYFTSVNVSGPLTLAKSRYHTSSVAVWTPISSSKVPRATKCRNVCNKPLPETFRNGVPT